MKCLELVKVLNRKQADKFADDIGYTDAKDFEGAWDIKLIGSWVLGERVLPSVPLNVYKLKDIGPVLLDDGCGGYNTYHIKAYVRRYVAFIPEKQYDRILVSREFEETE